VPRVESAKTAERRARRELRRAARGRKRFEKGEIRRFTRRTRTRRVLIGVAISTVVVLVAILLVAVYSPILALRTITVAGNTRVTSDELHAVLDDQLGTPLALIDTGAITRELATFPAIRSYTTQTVPPDTLIVTIVERQPIGSIAAADGFRLVDPAGVVLQTTETRQPGVPLITVDPAATDSTAFDSIVEVLLALPATLLSQVDSISAQTKDDVTFVLAGGVQSVVWGSAEESDYKARVLALAVSKQDPADALEYDVSAPATVVVGQR
jgi:cell division protein FtsQ